MNLKRCLTPFCLLFIMSSGIVAAENAVPADSGFKGRIAWSCDGNHNDPDDWAASPVALAIFAEAGLRDRLVHFDYNSILPLTNPEWEKTHAESVLGAADRYGYDRARFFDCRKNLDACVADIAAAIDASSAHNPLTLIIAGPVEVAYLGIQKSRPDKRQFVFCLSHSRWNDGFASGYAFTHTKRAVIEQGVNWIQIPDQNRLLSLSPYGRPARPDEYAAFFWMRDAREPKVRFLWDRMVVSTRPDPSDAGMAWFLATGDPECDPVKLKGLLGDHRRPVPSAHRSQIRLEAENFPHLEGFRLEDRNDRNASHRLCVVSNADRGGIQIHFNEPFVKASARYSVEIRYRVEPGSHSAFSFFVNGVEKSRWESSADSSGWSTHTVPTVEISLGDELRVEATGQNARLDFVELLSEEGSDGEKREAKDRF